MPHSHRKWNLEVALGSVLQSLLYPVWNSATRHVRAISSPTRVQKVQPRSKRPPTRTCLRLSPQGPDLKILALIGYVSEKVTRGGVQNTEHFEDVIHGWFF